ALRLAVAAVEGLRRVRDTPDRPVAHEPGGFLLMGAAEPLRRREELALIDVGQAGQLVTGVGGVDHHQIEAAEMEHLGLDEPEMRERRPLAVLRRTGELPATAIGQLRAGVEKVEPARTRMAAQLVVAAREDPGSRGQEVAGRLKKVQPPGLPAIGVRIARAVLAEVGTREPALLRRLCAVAGIVVPALDLLAVDRDLEAARRAAVVVVADVEDEVRPAGGGGSGED